MNAGSLVITPNGGNSGTSAVGNLSVNGTSRFDLNNNDLVVRATAANKDAVHGDIEADIVSAQNGLDAALITKWDGPGITSSTARTFERRARLRLDRHRRDSQLGSRCDYRYPQLELYVVQRPGSHT